MTEPIEGLAPPHSLEAERQLLGAMLLNSTLATDIAGKIKSTDFYLPRHSRIFAKINDELAANRPTEPPALSVAFGSELARIGGPTALSDLAAECVNPLSSDHYVRILRDRSDERRWHTALTRGLHTIRQDIDTATKRDEIQRTIHEATTRDQDQVLLVPAGDVVDDSAIHAERIAAGLVPPGIKTGLRAYDEVVGGHTPGQLIVVAGRPSQGKSVLAQNMARFCAEVVARPALVFSTEMPCREMGNRLLSDVADVPLEGFKTGRWTLRQTTAINEAREKIRTWPLTFVDRCTTIPAIRSAVRRYIQQTGDLGIFVVDYLQRLQQVGTEPRRDLVVGSWVDDLKWLALETNSVAIVASQFNRASESRTDKKPSLGEMRDSGNIEQTADIAVIVHRENFYDRTKREGEADLDIAKHRNGAIGEVTVAAQLARSRFADLHTPRQRNRQATP